MRALTKTQQENATSTMRKLLKRNTLSCGDIIDTALEEFFSSMGFFHSIDERKMRLEEFQVIMDQLLIEA